MVHAGSAGYTLHRGGPSPPKEQVRKEVLPTDFEDYLELLRPSRQCPLLAFLFIYVI